MGKLAIKHYHIKTKTYDGMYIFLANSEYKESDFVMQKNCTPPLVWILFPEKVEAQLKVCAHIDLVCDFEFKQFKKVAKERVEELLCIASPIEVQEMIDGIESFIKQSIKNQHD